MGVETMQKYTCFTCLQESTDSYVCTHCGAKIESVDLANAEFSPPVSGAVICKAESELEVQKIDAAIKDLEVKYHDSFDLSILGTEVSIKCNDLSGGRLISVLKKIIKEPLAFVED